MRIQNNLSKIILSVVLIIIFYVGLTIYSDINKIRENFSQANLFYLIPIISIYVAVMFTSSVRQRFLLKKLGFKISVRDSFFLSVASLSMLVTPFGSGQIIKTYFMKKKYNYALSQTFPLVVLERFSDLFVVCFFVLVSLFAHHTMISIIVLIISYCALGIFIISIKNQKIFRALKSLIRKLPFLSQLSIESKEFDDKIKKIFSWKIIFTSLIITAVGVSLESLVIHLGFRAFNVNFDYLETTQMFYTSIIAGALSLIPGGVGLTEGSFVNTLVSRGFSLDFATSVIIFIRITTIWFATVIGFIFSFLILRKGSLSH